MRRNLTSKQSLHARSKAGMKDMAITMRMSKDPTDYEEVPDLLAVTAGELTQRMVDQYVLYIPRIPWLLLTDNEEFVLRIEPNATQEDWKYGYLGRYLGIGMVTDAFCPPHRRLQAELHPDRVYWTKVAKSDY